jgi:coiled-coil domain-containing protein 55
MFVLFVYKFFISLQQEAEKGVQKKQTKFEMQRALEQDPTVYQYDEIYDKLEQKKIEAKTIQKGQEKKVQATYIHCVLKI